MHQSLSAENSVFLHVAPSTTLTQRLIRRRPDIAGPAISLLLGTLRRTQEALAALHAMREARLIPFSFNPRRPRTKGSDGFPSECTPQHEALSKRAKRAFISPASNPPKTGHRRGRRLFSFRRIPQDARSPRRTKCAARASCMSEDAPERKQTAAPDNDYRAIDYPVFCKPAETPVTVERIRLMYSAFFSSAISSWFIRTSRRARTWAMDRAST